VSPGLLDAIVGNTVLCPPNDPAALEQVLAQDKATARPLPDLATFIASN